MSYALAALEHAAFQISEYNRPPLTKCTIEPSGQKTPTTRQESPPSRVPLASRFFSGVSTLARRVCVWVKEQAASTVSPITRFFSERRRNENLLQISQIGHNDDLEWKAYRSESESS